MGNKNKSVSSNEKSQKPKDSKDKKDKKPDSEKKEVAIFINEQEANKIISSAKVITVQELARQTNVRISTANTFLQKSNREFKTRAFIRRYEKRSSIKFYKV